jgi:hypothetical protein
MNIKSLGLIAGLVCRCWNSANAVLMVTPQVVSPTQFNFTEDMLMDYLGPRSDLPFPSRPHGP